MSKQEIKLRVIRCPKCSRQTAYNAASPFRPFCSERCQIADLAAWATESYRAPGEAISPEEFEEIEIDLESDDPH